MKTTCPLCECENIQGIFEADNAFVSVAELSLKPYLKEHTQGEKEFRGDMKIKLFQCRDCGYTFNANFDDEKMSKAYFSGNYITPKAISSTISWMILNLSKKIKSYAKSEYVFLEIAPGGCDLLFALSKDSHFAYSIDPSFTPEILLKDIANITHIRALFSYENVANKLKHKINFIIFRHLIEHLEKPRQFLKDIVNLLEYEGMIYIEVPNMLEIAENKRFYEIRHEHVGYHQSADLIKALNELGCELIELDYIHEKQWFGLFFKKTKNFKKDENLKPVFFDKSLNKALHSEIHKLDHLLKNYKNIAIYGAGSHANSLLSYISLENCKKISCAIDKDERRQGTYLLNSDIKIKAPSAENLKDIDCVLMAIPAYEEVVFQNEIVKFANGGGVLKFYVIRTTKGINLIEFKNLKD